MSSETSRDEPSGRSPLRELLEQFWQEREAGVARPVGEYLEILASHELAGADREEAIDVSRAVSSLLAGGTDAKHIGQYRIERELGRGAQGVVYLATDTRLGRQVAVKVLTGGLGSGLLLRRFHREAEITARLEHPGICPVYDTGFDDGTAYIAMRYVDGEPLSRLIFTARETDHVDTYVDLEDISTLDQDGDDTEQEERPPPSLDRKPIMKAVALVEDVARTLHGAHEAGVIHRDVKPGNIMIGRDRRPVLMDFGLARDDAADVSLTQTGDFLGTPAYMSPEQLSGGKRVDRRADVWSLGVVLHECVTLRRPFEAATAQALYQAIRTREPDDPKKLQPKMPRDLAVVILTALEKDLDRRYETAEHLADELRRVRMGKPIEAKPISSIARVVRWAGRNRTVASLLGLTILALTVGFVVSFVSLLGRDAALRELKQRNAEIKAGATAQRLIDQVDSFAHVSADSADAIAGWLDRARPLQAYREALRSRLDDGTDTLSDADRDSIEGALSQLDRLFQPRAFAKTVKEMERRLVVARLLRKHLDDTDRWDGAITAIEDLRAYRNLDLIPQSGLVSLGPDPESGLWEFADCRSGEIPKRDPESGELHLSERTSTVFVLIPQGSFRMGAQSEFEGGPNYDKNATQVEGPVRSVRLDAYLLSKYELTQAQWLQLTGSNPSNRAPPLESYTLRHPVERVSWDRANKELAHLGWLLPTEAQWEYACRAQSDTPWFTGADSDGIRGYANIGGLENEGETIAEGWTFRSWNDGYVYHAPVGSYRANRWGLHDMQGNVDELCRETYIHSLHPELVDIRDGDGLLQAKKVWVDPNKRAKRGAEYYGRPFTYRSAFREFRDHRIPYQRTGIRPVRVIE